LGVEVVEMTAKMTAKEVLELIIREGLPPEGWGRCVWRGQHGYGVSSLVPENTLPPVEDGEVPLFWLGGVSKANIPYWPEAFVPDPEDLEGEEAEEAAERVLLGHLLAECIRELPDADWENYVDALRSLRGLEAEVALESV
jgi:hypothetical protein